MLQIKVLSALAGDCIILKIHHQNIHKMLIVDGGMGRECFRNLTYEIENWNNCYGAVDLVILTHIDNDHISGLIKILSAKKTDSSVIKKIWFNYGRDLEAYFNSFNTPKIMIPEESLKTSFRQGNELYALLMDKNISVVAPILVGKHEDINSVLHMDILSPTEKELKTILANKEYYVEESETEIKTSAHKEIWKKSIEDLNNQLFSEKDVTVTNASSIACLVVYLNRKILLLGDAKASVIENSLRKLGFTEDNPIKVDYCKISHHGSKSNTSNTLIQLIDCEQYIISSNWKSERPSKECLSRIVMNSKHPVKFLCNYKYEKSIFTEEEYNKYNMEFILIKDMELTIDDPEV